MNEYMKPYEGCQFEKVVVNGSSLEVTLNNGLTFSISSNPESLYFSLGGLSGSGRKLVPSLIEGSTDPRFHLDNCANYCHLEYRKEEK